MDRSNRVWNGVGAVFLALCLILGSNGVRVARADTVPQPIPISLDWSDTNLITTLNDWSGVPGVVGYLGTGLGNKTTGIDPQTILVDGTNTTIKLSPNLTNPNYISSAGIVEFEIDDPTIAMSGSNAPHAPFLLINLNTLGRTTISISYDVRDLESTNQDAVQQVALHYRVGSSGNFTNLPDGYVADATEPNTATKVTHVFATLPTAAENQELVQVRIMTANAIGRDEWVGIDNIIVDGNYMPDEAPVVANVTPTVDATLVAVNSGLTVTFSEPVYLTDGWFSLDCGVSGLHQVTIVNTDSQTYTINPSINFASAELCTAMVVANHVSDLDGLPPENPAADFSWTFTTADTSPALTLTCPEWSGESLIGIMQGFLLTLDNPANGPTMPHAQLKFTFTGADAGDVTEMAVYNSVDKNWEDLPLIVEPGGLAAYLGSTEGISVPSPYSSVRLFELRFNHPGAFPLSIQWLDLDTAPPTVVDECNDSRPVGAFTFLPLIFR